MTRPHGHQTPVGAATRVRRTVELAYSVEGVVAVRVWQWGTSVAVGVRGAASASSADLVRRVEAAVAVLRQPGEAWDVGILEETSDAAPEQTL